MLYNEIELEPGFIFECGSVVPLNKTILEYSPRPDYIDFGVCLKGEIHVDVEGISESFVTRENSGNIVHGGSKKAVHELYPGLEHRWVNIRLTTDFLERSTAHSLDFIFDKIQKKKRFHNSLLHYCSHGLTPSMKSCVTQIMDSAEPYGAKRLLLRAKCLELVAYQLDELGLFHKDVILNDSLDRKIRQARDILLQNYRNPPTVKELSRIIGISETYLKKAFKDRYQTSIYQYLLSFRMEQARFLIDRHKMTVSEAGYAVGYSSVSQFSSAFKRYHGSSPGRIRGIKMEARLYKDLSSTNLE